MTHTSTSAERLVPALAGDAGFSEQRRTENRVTTVSSTQIVSGVRVQGWERLSPPAHVPRRLVVHFSSPGTGRLLATLLLCWAADSSPRLSVAAACQPDTIADTRLLTRALTFAAEIAERAGLRA